MHGFAGDMVFEILTWLPAKSLMRFRCVSKVWNSLIRHDLNFVKLHNARSHARPEATRLLFELQIGTPHRDDVVESTSNAPTQLLEGFPLQLVRPRNYFDSREITICSNHCNGLVCLFSRKDTQVHLYNITTGEIKALSFSLGCTKIWYRNPKLHLGYDSATESYKLLRDVIYYKKRPRFKILTLGTNSWRRIREKSPIRFFGGGIFLNGVLYWTSFSKRIIAYFNFTKEKFGTLSPPQKSHVNEILTAMWRRLIVHPCYQPKKSNFVYDEGNKVFMKLDSNRYSEVEKAASLEAESIDERPKYPKVILATSSLISTSTCLVFSSHFWFRHISSFVENIIPLTFIEV